MLLLGLGLNPARFAFLVLTEAIDIARENPFARAAIYKEIYPVIMHEYGLRSDNAVDLHIRRAIDALWKSRPDFIAEIIFCGQLSRKPTPAQTIAAFAVYLGEPED